MELSGRHRLRERVRVRVFCARVSQQANLISSRLINEELGQIAHPYY